MTAEDEYLEKEYENAVSPLNLNKKSKESIYSVQVASKERLIKSEQPIIKKDLSFNELSPSVSEDKIYKNKLDNQKHGISEGNGLKIKTVITEKDHPPPIMNLQENAKFPHVKISKRIAKTIDEDLNDMVKKPLTPVRIQITKKKLP